MAETSEFICITEFENYTSFALVSGGKYASVQYRNSDIPDPVGGVWSVQAGAQPMHQFARAANWIEAVRVDGSRFAPELYLHLRTLLKREILTTY